MEKTEELTLASGLRLRVTMRLDLCKIKAKLDAKDEHDQRLMRNMVNWWENTPDEMIRIEYRPIVEAGK